MRDLVRAAGLLLVLCQSLAAPAWRDLVRVAGLLLVLGPSLAAWAWSEPPVTPAFAPDQKSAEPGSVGVFPIRDGGNRPEFLDPAGLEAHLQPRQDRTRSWSSPPDNGSSPPPAGTTTGCKGAGGCLPTPACFPMRPAPAR